MKSDGTELRQLTKIEMCSNGNPAWSPNGRQIVFASTCIDVEAHHSLYRIDTDGLNLIRLTKNKGADITPKWSPDGRKIAFVSTRDGNNEIYLMNSDGSNQMNITNSLWWENEPAWSLDGKKIVFESVREGDPLRSFRLQGYKPEIYVMNVDGSEILQITDNDVFDVNPEWKP
jgi:TolB protein